jgi:DNA-binding CsgD family transcriptional regulator
MSDRDSVIVAGHKVALVWLTPAELESWILAERGMSQRNIALALGVSRSTIRSRLENAARKLAQAQKEPAA